MPAVLMTAAVFFCVSVFCIVLEAQSKPQKITFTGKLSRAMAIGAETTGWSVDLDSPMTIEGKEVHSIEISYAHPDRLDKLANQHVRVKGTVAHQQGVETGQRTIVNASSIKAANGP
jgi:hypothetical protein